MRLTPRLDLSALVTCHTLCVHFTCLQSAMFLLNSRMGPFTAPPGIALKDPFSRSYGASLPSSLAVTHSSACGFSPRPPVSVSGTGRHALKLSGFSREPPSPRCPLGRSLRVLSQLSTGRVLHSAPYTFLLQPAIPSAGGGSGPPSPLRMRAGHGNVDPSPLGTASIGWPPLGPG